MQAEWRNAAHTILALTGDTGHVVIVEPGHALWASAASRPDIASFAPEPVPEPTPEEIRAALPLLTRRQVFIALLRLGLISAPEAVAAAASGIIPPALEPTFADIPEPGQTDARVTFAAFQMADRLDPLSAIIAQVGALDDAALDAIWRGFADV